MTAAVITVVILSVIGLVILREYSKFKDEQKEQEARQAQLKKSIEIPKVETPIQTKITEVLNTVKVEDVIKTEVKPKRKYTPKKKTQKTKK